MLLQWHNSSLSPRLVTNLCAFYRPLRLTHWHPPHWRHTRDNTAEEAEVTSKEVDWRLELQTNLREVWAALKHYTNQPARPLWPSSCYHYPTGKSPAIIQLQASRRFVWSFSGGGVVSIFSTINHWSDTGPVFTPSPGQPSSPHQHQHQPQPLPVNIKTASKVMKSAIIENLYDRWRCTAGLSMNMSVSTHGCSNVVHKKCSLLFHL